jgi:transcriptional regulator with XRE-family HTH domain
MVGARCCARTKCNNSVPIANGARAVIHGCFVRSSEEVEHVLHLAGQGLSQSEIARRTGVPRPTVGGWLRGKLPRRHPLPTLDGRAYSYLLGMYLGDGHIARFPRTLRLQIYLDTRYPGIIGECVRAIRRVMPLNRVAVHRRRPHNVVHVSCYSQRWASVLPQHGAGLKHARSIELTGWQREITHTFPERLIRGLIHSDGCRVLNRVRHGEKVYIYPRYMFSNRSRQIHGIFTEHLDLLGIEWRWSNGHTISVARRDSVAKLDGFVGPKR